MSQHSSLPGCPWFFGLPFALSGLLLLVLMVTGSQSLALGTPGTRLALAFLLLLPAVLALVLLRWEGCPNTTLLLAVLPIAVTLYLRLLCLDYQSGDYTAFLASWSAFFRENGGFSALDLPVGNYNVPYLYFLAAISYLPIPDLYLIKLFSILFDILLAWGGLRLTRLFCRDSSPAPLLCFFLLLFLPTVTLNGAYWGQCDSLYGALLLLAISFALEGRPKTSVILLAVAFSFKLQTVFLIPLWCVFWYTGRVKFRHLLLFPAGYAVTILPALALGKPLWDILRIYLEQAGTYSSLTLNAPSVFGFLPYGAQTDASLLSTLGIIAAFLLVLVLLALLFFKRNRITSHALLNAAAVLAIGVPFLLPHMHDRYFFPADVITLVWACIDPRRIPVALLVQTASASCYCIYLNLQYTFPLYVGGQYYVLAVEATCMLAALIWSLAALFRHPKTADPQP